MRLTLTAGRSLLPNEFRPVKDFFRDPVSSMQLMPIYEIPEFPDRTLKQGPVGR
jgi:hypothetical protein